MAMLRQPGPRNAIPLMLLMLVGFAAPLLAVIGFSVVPARTFSLWQMPTLENYAAVFSGTNYISFVYSLVFAALTVIVLAVICYPVALGLVRVFGKWSMFMSLLFTIPLFVSENVRLYGWVLFDMLPTPWTWVGAPVIVASGLYIVWREHRVSRHPQVSEAIAD